MADRIIFVCILLLAGGYFYATEQLPSLEIGDPLGPKAFPRLLVIALLVTAGVFLFEMIRGRKATPAQVPKTDAADSTSYKVVAAVTVWTLVYFLLFEPLGYVIATTIYLFAIISYFHRGKWMVNVLTALLVPLCSYLAFNKLLGVNLARGILPF